MEPFARSLIMDANRYRALPMPEPLVREMVADWMGAGRAITGQWDVAGWYTKNREKMDGAAPRHTRARRGVDRRRAPPRASTLDSGTAMRYDRIDAYEADFRLRGRDSDAKRFRMEPGSVPIPGSSERLHVVRLTRLDGVKSFYYEEAAKKERIALHFTAGYLKGDIAALTKADNHVSTPFVIARDGTIYQLFSSKYWSYSLGKNAAGGNKPMCKSSVAVEMSNVAYLRPKPGGVLVDPYGAEYCNEADTAAYVKLPKPFRGHTRFATFTDQQYSSLATLLRYLSATYSIPLRLLPEARRYDVVPDVASWRGITTHVNYQPQAYGKWDIGPAFDWHRLGAS
jgi:N-acetyl-anhydromuramyl-L-alanine amidase AmpD